MHSHVDSTWPSVHPTTMKTSSNPGCIWTKLPPWRHAAHKTVLTAFHNLPQWQMSVAGRGLGGVVHALGIPRTRHSDFNNILLPTVSGNRFQPTVSQNNVRPGHETTIQLFGWQSHVFVPGQRMWSGQCLCPWSVWTLARSHGFPSRPWTSSCSFWEASFFPQASRLQLIDMHLWISHAHLLAQEGFFSSC